VRGDAEGLDHDLRPAALADLHVAAGGLADHDDVGLHGAAHAARGDALEELLVHDAGQGDLAREVALRVLEEEVRRRGERRDRALHVGRAAAVEPAVFDLARIGVARPAARDDRHRVDVAVEEHARAGTPALQPDNHAAVAVDRDLVEAVRPGKALQLRRDALLMAGRAGM